MENSDRQHWLWIIRPEYYLDENACIEEILIWQVDLLLMTGECHEETKNGYLVLPWRTWPKSDIDYMISAESDSYDPNISNEKWDYA